MEVNFIMEVIKGAGIGLGYAFTGYLKNIKVEDFDLRKAGPTLIIGALVGAAASYYGVDMLTSEGILGGFGAVALVNMAWAAFVKHAQDKGWFGWKA